MTESAPHDDADILEHELELEQRHVDHVYERLEAAMAEARNVEAESRARFTSDRADWLREEDSTALFERDAFAYQASRRLAILDEEHEGLVFGRLDLLLDKETRYIGRLGVRDEDYEPLVIDWRAPAAEAFYRATPNNPMGVVRRRVLRCRADKVIGIEDDLLDTEADTDLVVIGEGALMAALGRARGQHMRSIVATIQAEQDEAIRAPYQGVTTIAGGPGTGKTVVALHRAAYLLYTHRKRLERGGVLVVGPSDVFMNYIERVLPGLGEDAVTLRSVGRVADDVLGLGSDRQDSAEATILKGSLVMSRLLRRLVNEPLVAQGAQQLRVTFSGEILTLDAKALAAMRNKILANNKLNEARHIAEQALLGALYAKLPPALAKDVERDEFDDKVTTQASWQMFVNAWWPPLDAEQVLARLAEPTLAAKVSHGLLDADQQAVLSESLSQSRGYVPAAGMAHPQWSVSDIPLLDELAMILGPLPEPASTEPDLFLDSTKEELVTTADLLSDQRDTEDDELLQNYSHVLVDEAQDITPMQWRMIRRRGPQASWTIVGDPAQSSYPEAAQTDRAMRELIGRAPHRTFRLATNYRSPAEVMNLAGRFIRTYLPEADLPNAVRSTGIEPELAATTPEDLDMTVRALIERLLGQVEGTIGVIVPPSAVEEVRTFDPGSDRVLVVTALQAKGLEYDAALVINPDQIIAEAPGGPRVLYVALTRPTQRLITLDVTTGGVPGEWRESLG
ncbi:AAA family ATPase [Propionibacterium freudenreichii]|uniref:HelD family protein n=1 Tax=Propionibacterium freudenreichii TaxID=1744 RepID=UPI00101EE1A0|nr:UvrD-helicase domain-containing protein [Propionibacterium freudenreichii]MDK9645419.1 AAA family ATPase [Propionibacterium freudenreichii]MDK9665471.1 AAA family ATPase [Propionibacterium freudenreichii]